MRILLVSRFFPYIGGREVLVMLLAQKLSENHEVVIATPDIGRVSKDFQIISNDTESLTRCFKDFKPEVINSHTFYLTPELIKLGKKFNTPVVLTIHGDIFGYGSDPDKELFKAMIPELDSIVTVCDHGKEQMLKNGVSESKLTRIYSGIDTDIFDGAEDKSLFRKSFQLPEDKFIFITPARMTKYKGIETLIDAIHGLKKDIRSKCLFWITTPATRYREDELEYTKKIFEKVSLLGIKENIMVSFNDFVSMPFAYRAANAFVLPSLTEQFPVTILEAMASRLPVIATNVGGVGEVVNEETGNLISPDNAGVLAEALVKVFESKDLAKANKAYNVVRAKFNLNHMVEGYLKLYNNLKNGK